MPRNIWIIGVFYYVLCTLENRGVHGLWRAVLEGGQPLNMDSRVGTRVGLREKKRDLCEPFEVLLAYSLFIFNIFMSYGIFMRINQSTITAMHVPPRPLQQRAVPPIFFWCDQNDFHLRHESLPIFFHHCGIADPLVTHW